VVLVVPFVSMRFALRWKVIVSIVAIVFAIVTLHISVPTSGRWVFAALIALLLLGFAGLLYWWVDRPLRSVLDLLEGTKAQGFLRRSAQEGQDEFGQLGQGYNRLLARITDLDATRIDQDLELKWAQEKLQLQGDLDQKTRQLEKRLRERELLANLARTFSSTLEINEVLDSVCDRISAALAIDEVAVLIAEEHSDDLIVAAASGVPVAEEIQGLRFAVGEGITGRVWAGAGPVYIPDVRVDDQFLHWKGKHELDDASFVSVLMEFAGEKLGVVDFTRHRTHAFSQPELDMLEIIVQQAAVSIRNARLYQRTRILAVHDELTGLLNRRTFMERLEREWRRRVRFGGPMSVLVVDVDHFKTYNDSHGHLVGDRVLVHIAQVIRSAVRSVDVVARYGGEEFVLMLIRSDLETARAVGEKLRKAVAESEAGVEGVATPTISVGVACERPTPGESQPLDLLDAADQALLRAKKGGRNRVEFREEEAP
jgi:diguanylate cyclase (GGDEF)-like protein